MGAPPTAQVVQWSEEVLERKRIAALSTVTRQLLADAKIDVSDTLGMMADQMVLRMESLVLVDPKRTKDEHVEIKTPPIYVSWRAQRVAALPEGSLRRRLLTRLYGLQDKPLAYRLTRGVKVHREAVLPEANHQFPGYGPMHLKVQTSVERPRIDPA